MFNGNLFMIKSIRVSSGLSLTENTKEAVLEPSNSILIMQNENLSRLFCESSGGMTIGVRP